MDQTSGELTHSGNPCDLALSGSGYFTVLDSSGRAYTRNGAFHLDANQNLVDQQDHPVMGERGPIQITGDSFTVNGDGSVVVDGAAVDKLLIANFPASRAVREGDSLLHVPAASVQTEPAPQVKQGYVEASNVNSMEEMISMITDLRTYEATQKVISGAGPDARSHRQRCRHGNRRLSPKLRLSIETAAFE